jgi:DNA polymerase-3 subunit beta
MHQITVSKDAIRASLQCAAKDDIRYYLNGLCFELGDTGKNTAVNIIATNGHVLSIMREYAPEVSADNFGTFIVPRTMLEKIKAQKKHESKTVTITADLVSNDCTVEYDGVKLTGKLVDGKFPDVRRVMPRKISGEPAQYKPDLLARFQTAGEILVGKKFYGPVIGYNGQSAAAVSIGTDNYFGVIMPFRTDDMPENAPAWVFENLEPAKAAA